jgi:radical SAM superfamily enzyme YgiQ (UPF0313 family)
MENKEDQFIDVLLICPNYHSKFLITDAIVYPINLAMLAAYLRERNITVKIIDGRAFNYRLNDYKKDIVRYNPKIVGITVVTSFVNQAVDIAKEIKNISKDIFVVVGGAHISALPEETLKNYEYFDIAVVGEGEQTLYELTEKIIKKDYHFSDIDGIYYRENGNIQFTKTRALFKDLDSLPYPAFDLLSLEKYRPTFQWIKKKPFLMIIASRGCPYNCVFCSSKSNFGRTVRYRSPESIIDEIVLYKKKYGIKQIIFYDDTLVINKNRIHKLCDLMIERKLDIVWGCFSSVNAMDRELAEKMKKAGCFTIFFGIESGSEYMLKKMNKGYQSVYQAQQVVKDVREVGLQPVGSFIIGVPGETEETIKITIDYALKLPLSYAAMVPCVPFPGSQVYEYAKKNKIIPETITDWTQFEAYREPFVLSSVPKEKLEYYTAYFFKKFYFRIPIIFEIIKNSFSFYKIKHGISTAFMIIKLFVFKMNKGS